MYQEIATMFNKSMNSVTDSKEYAIERSKEFELMLATEDLTKLRAFVLYGNLESLIQYNNHCKDSNNKVDFDAVLKLYKNHNWNKGYKLLNDAISRFSHKYTKWSV